MAFPVSTFYPIKRGAEGTNMAPNVLLNMPLPLLLPLLLLLPHVANCAKNADVNSAIKMA
jgi:hypothetical protein